MDDHIGTEGLYSGLNAGLVSDVQVMNRGLKWKIDSRPCCSKKFDTGISLEKF